MTHVAPWVLVSLMVAWLLRSRPIVGVYCVIVLWSVMPAVAGHYLTRLSTGALAFHPATWLLLSILAVQLLTNSAPLGRVVGQHPYVFLVVTFFAIGGFVTSRVQTGGGTRLLMDQIVGPMVLFWLVVGYAAGKRTALLGLRNVLLVVVAAQSVLTVIQSRLQRIVFYEKDYAKLSWFNPLTFDRWMGTTDSPLVLSLAICVAAPLTLSLKNSFFRVALLILYLVGALITQSRTGTVLMMMIILYTILRARTVLWARVLTCVVLGVAGYLIATSVLVRGLAGRLTNDTGSTGARLRALSFLYQHWADFLVVGRGLTSSYVVAQNAGLQTSLESSFLMYVVDTGLILAGFYFGMQICLIALHGSQRALVGATLSAVVGCGLQHTFSGVAGTNLSGTFIWTVLAIVVVSSELRHGPVGAMAALQTPGQHRNLTRRISDERLHPELVARH